MRYLLVLIIALAGCQGAAIPEEVPAPMLQPIPPLCTPGSIMACTMSDGRPGIHTCWSLNLWGPCLADSYCGDKIPDPTETLENCAEDVAVCGDTFCSPDAGEGALNCPEDCASCEPDVSYCDPVDDSLIRQCNSSGEESILIRDCGLQGCVVCPANGAVSCGPAAAPATGDATGVVFEEINAHGIQGCPGDVSHASYRVGTGLVWGLALQSGARMSLHIRDFWFQEMTSGVPTPLVSEALNGHLMFQVNNGIDPQWYLNSPDAICELLGGSAPCGTVTITWTSLDPGSIIRIQIDGDVTRTSGATCAPQAVDALVLLN